MAKFSLNTFLKIGLLVGSLVVLGRCTFRTPATETPKPDQQNIEKSFFVNSNGKPKTFMCGWASINQVGIISEYTQTHNAPITTHCNMQFFITETDLLGKMINPSFPNDPGRWQTAVKIPIRSHYYYEKEKDSSGRDTTRFIENSSRSHWSARPYIKLNLTGLNILKSDFGLVGFDPESGSGGGSQQINAVDDIEWDTKNGFLGFTVQASAPMYGSENQGLFRVNFLEFQHNEKFKKTPFSDKNYTYLNALHIVGEKVDGVYPILYAAHWDLSKTHQVYLNGFPPEYEDIAADIVKEWNEAFASVPGLIAKGHKPFVLTKTKSKHIFDLRKTAITWTSDVKISSTSPLGIGQTIADVRNGEILWGSINLYGGTLLNSIKAFSPIDGSSMSGKNNFSSFIFNSRFMPETLSLPPGVLAYSSAATDAVMQNYVQKLTASINVSAYQSGLAEAQKKVESIQDLKDDKGVLGKIQKDLQQRLIPADAVKSILQSIQAEIAKKSFETSSYFSATSYQKRLADMLPKSQLESREGKSEKDENDSLKKRLKYQLHTSSFDFDRTIQDVAPGWAMGMSQMRKDHNEVVRVVIKELISHEYGHVMGLGHQFKENILPDPDKVPAEIFESLQKKATPEAHFTNFTSVMGYRNPKTEIADDYQNIKPGPHDRLVIAFLYGQKYATFKKGDPDFRFVDLPPNGIIPESDPKNPEYLTSYFPQCNDMEASLSVDPYCNRWDAGINAKGIVENYLADLKDNLTPTLFSFADSRGGNAEMAEAHLWKRSMATFGRVRVFYDYMRHKYRKQIEKIRTDEKAIFAFSTSCSSGKEQSSELKEIFENEPEFRELCEVNRLVLDEITDYGGLNTSDYTKMDSDNRYTPGGISGGDAGRDYSHAFGTWTELNGLVLKVASTLALVTPFPWVQLGGGMFGIPNYNTPNERFSYSSLYPTEYTKAISNIVKRSIYFATLNPNERTRMGQAAIALSGLLRLGQYNNDKNIFTSEYLEKINSQTKFNLSMVAILIDGDPKDGPNVDRYDRFKGRVYDFTTGKEIPLTETYLLPEGRVFVKGEDMFIFPITKLHLYSDKGGYVIAYKIDYFREYDNKLSDFSVKTELKQLHDQLVARCIDGDNGKINGLKSFFNTTEKDFAGFLMPVGLLSDSVEKGKLFQASIKEAFSQYEKSRGVTDKVCSEATRGLGLIISSAAVVSGFWIPEVEFYLQH